MSEEEIKEVVEEEQTSVDEYNQYVTGYNDAVTEIKSTKQNPLKSKVFWIAILSLVGVVIVNVFNLIDDTVWNTVVTSVLSLMSAFGILNSPFESDSLG